MSKQTKHHVDIMRVTDPDTKKEYIVATSLLEVEDDPDQPMVYVDCYLSDGGEHTVPAYHYASSVLTLSEFQKDLRRVYDEVSEVLLLALEGLSKAIKVFEERLAETAPST